MSDVPTTLDRDRIRALIPHAGAMCLLDRVDGWDAGSIVCGADSHRAPDNPLRAGGVLPIEAGIEYAAQAMAVHGGLMDGGGPPRRGYVAVLNRVQWSTARLDEVPGALRITAWSLQAGDDGRQYAFRIDAGETVLIEGEALVMLEATDR